MSLPSYTVISLNSIELALVPEPTLNTVYPQNVFSLIDLNIVYAYGADFTSNSVCVFDTSNGLVMGKIVIVTPNRVVDDGQIACSTKSIMKGKSGGQSIMLSISNDLGRTLSNSIEISFRRHLPRVLQLARPNVIFADESRVDILLTGVNLFPGMQMIATKVDNSAIIVTSYCNSTESVSMQCFDLQFSLPGDYTVDISISETSD